MIKVKNINGNPETIPNTVHGSHTDGKHFFFFESDQERIDFLNALPVQVVQEEKGDALNALLKAKPHEINQIKELLGIK